MFQKILQWAMVRRRGKTSCVGSREGLNRGASSSNRRPECRRCRFRRRRKAILGPSNPSKREEGRGSFRGGTKAAVTLTIVFNLITTIMFRTTGFTTSEFLGANGSSIRVGAASDISLRRATSSSDATSGILSSSRGKAMTTITRTSVPSMITVAAIDIRRVPDFFKCDSHRCGDTSANSKVVIKSGSSRLLVTAGGRIISKTAALDIYFVKSSITGTRARAIGTKSGKSLGMRSTIDTGVGNASTSGSLTMITIGGSSVPRSALGRVGVTRVKDSSSLTMKRRMITVNGTLKCNRSMASN